MTRSFSESGTVSAEKQACPLSACRFDEAGLCDPHGEACPDHEPDDCGLVACPWRDLPEQIGVGS